LEINFNYFNKVRRIVHVMTVPKVSVKTEKLRHVDGLNNDHVMHFHKYFYWLCFIQISCIALDFLNYTSYIIVIIIISLLSLSLNRNYHVHSIRDFLKYIFFVCFIIWHSFGYWLVDLFQVAYSTLVASSYYNCLYTT